MNSLIMKLRHLTFRRNNLFKKKKKEIGILRANRLVIREFFFIFGPAAAPFRLAGMWQDKRGCSSSSGGGWMTDVKRRLLLCYFHSSLLNVLKGSHFSLSLFPSGGKGVVSKDHQRCSLKSRPLLLLAQTHR